MKGRTVQYHSNISKDEGRIFYEKFITLCEVFCASTFVLLSRLKPSFCESLRIPTNLHELSHKLLLFCNYCGPCSYFVGIRAVDRRARLSFLYRFHIEMPVFFS